MFFVQSSYVLVLLGAALVPECRSRHAAMLAAVASGLVLAGLRAATTPYPPEFLAVAGALLVMAIGLATAAAALAGRTRRDWTSLVPAALLLVGAVGMGSGARGWLAAAPPGSLVLAVAILGAIGLVLHGVGRLIRFPARSAEVGSRPHAAAVAGLLVGAVLVAVGTHVQLVFTGVVLAAWSGWLIERAVGRTRLPAAPLLTLVLIPAWWLLEAIAGAEGLGVGALPSLPTSPAAERLLAPLLLLAAWATAGLFPLHRQLPAAITAPVGAMLLARLALPIVPEGIEHWRPLAAPLIVLGIWHAALSGRAGALGIGLAWIGLLGGSRGGTAGAALLLAGALALDLPAAWRQRLGVFAPVTAVASALSIGVGGLLAIESGLRAEVVYTALAAAGVVAAAAGFARSATAAESQPSR